MQRPDKARAVFDSLTREENDCYLQCPICIMLRLFKWVGSKNSGMTGTIMHDGGTFEQLRLMQCKVCLRRKWVTLQELAANKHDEK